MHHVLIILTLKTAIQNCHNTPAHDDAPLYQVCKQKVQNFRYFFKDLSPHCNLDLKDRNPNFSHETPGHDDTSTYQVFKKGLVVQKMLSGQIFPEDWNPRCDHDLEDSNPKLSHNTPTHDDAPLCQIWLQKFRRYSIYYMEDLRISAHTVTLTLKIGTQTFHMTLQVMVHFILKS